MTEPGRTAPPDSDGLEPRVVNETVLMRTAVKQVKQLTRTSRWQWIAIALICILAVVSAWSLWRLNDTIRQVHQNTISNCTAGNAYRAGDEKGWDEFIRIAVRGSAHPAAAEAIAKPFLGYIHRLDAPRDCANGLN